MKMFDCFRDLLVFGDDIGKVDNAHWYDEGYCSVEGTDREGNKFTLSLTIKREPICEKFNEGRNEND